MTKRPIADLPMADRQIFFNLTFKSTFLQATAAVAKFTFRLPISSVTARSNVMALQMLCRQLLWLT
jgi:hypothetical protein